MEPYLHWRISQRIGETKILNLDHFSLILQNPFSLILQNPFSLILQNPFSPILQNPFSLILRRSVQKFGGAIWLNRSFDASGDRGSA